jgi:hypothetical protein
VLVWERLERVNWERGRARLDYVENFGVEVGEEAEDCGL